MAANPFTKLAPAKGKPAAKPAAKPTMGKPMSPASAKAVANFVKGKKGTPITKLPAMDAEDKLDGGIDEATEK